VTGVALADQWATARDQLSLGLSAYAERSEDLPGILATIPPSLADLYGRVVGALDGPIGVCDHLAAALAQPFVLMARRPDTVVCIPCGPLLPAHVGPADACDLCGATDVEVADGSWRPPGTALVLVVSLCLPCSVELEAALR
jgi:hypothetical protein